MIFIVRIRRKLVFSRMRIWLFLVRFYWMVGCRVRIVVGR